MLENKKYIIEVEVNEEWLIKHTEEMVEPSTNIKNRIFAEMGWMQESGIYVKNVKEVVGYGVVRDDNG
jgi:hypothetical protein